jgi:hypothetical protein
MSIYTYESALIAMKSNPAIVSITYKSEMRGESLYLFTIEREENYFWHICKKRILPKLHFRGEVAEPLPFLPAPSSPLVRQIATGFTTPKPEPLSKICIPKSDLCNPESGTLAPRAYPEGPLSPLSLTLSRHASSLEEDTYENTHLFFDEDGNEILAADKFQITIKDSSGSHLSIFHPRVLLFYLRFLATYNEDTKKALSWPVLTTSQRHLIYQFITHHPPPPEFKMDVVELFALMKLCPREY